MYKYQFEQVKVSSLNCLFIFFTFLKVATYVHIFACAFSSVYTFFAAYGSVCAPTELRTGPQVRSL